MAWLLSDHQRTRRCATEPAVTTALIASATSVVVAVTSALLAYRAQQRTQVAKAKHDALLEEFKTSLADLNAERDARRDYVYEARKRLYEVTQPLMFQLTERAEDLLDRITGLARTSRNGDLEPNGGWLSGDSYYLRTTMHRLVSPVAILHLLQDGLTLVDLNLDQETRVQYSMARQLAFALTDHYSFAKSEPSLAYNPDAPHPNGISRRRQGLPSGWVEAAGQSLITHQANGAAHVMRFGEFDESYSSKGSAVHRAFLPIAELLHDFHPRTHPVLWRALVTQAHLCAAFTAARDRIDTSAGERPSPSIPPWEAIPAKDRSKYDWRQSSDKVDDAEVLIEPFEAAKNYLESNLRPAKA